jgi:hypothetical protein
MRISLLQRPSAAVDRDGRERAFTVSPNVSVALQPL